MAFDAAKFGRMSNHDNKNLPSMFAYATADNQATVNTSGYFNDVANDVRVGDVIVTHHGSGTVILYNILSNAAGVVDVADGLTLGTTDTD